MIPKKIEFHLLEMIYCMGSIKKNILQNKLEIVKQIKTRF